MFADVPRFTLYSLVSFAALELGSKHPCVATPEGHRHVPVAASYAVATVLLGHPYDGHEKHTPFSVGCGNVSVGHVWHALPFARRTPAAIVYTTSARFGVGTASSSERSAKNRKNKGPRGSNGPNLTRARSYWRRGRYTDSARVGPSWNAAPANRVTNQATMGRAMDVFTSAAAKASPSALFLCPHGSRETYPTSRGSPRFSMLCGSGGAGEGERGCGCLRRNSLIRPRERDARS